MYKYIILLSLVFIAGCTTTQVSDEDAYTQIMAQTTCYYLTQFEEVNNDGSLDQENQRSLDAISQMYVIAEEMGYSAQELDTMQNQFQGNEAIGEKILSLTDELCPQNSP